MAFTAVGREWFAECTRQELGKICHLFIMETCRDYSKITNVGCGVDYNNGELEDILDTLVKVGMWILR